jgi:hypothetical protein
MSSSEDEVDENMQKNMADCLTYVNHTLGYELMDIVDYLNLKLDETMILDVVKCNDFLYESLSPMTRLS